MPFHQIEVWEAGTTAPPPSQPLSTPLEQAAPPQHPHLTCCLVAQFLGDGMKGVQVGSLLLAGGEDDSVSLPAKQTPVKA